MSLHARRSVLAACGVAALSGCPSILERGSTASDVECGPADHTWSMAGRTADRTSRAPPTDLPPSDAHAVRLSQTGVSADGGGSVDASPVVDDGVAYVAGDVRAAAYDLETGEERWTFEPERGVDVSPALGCGTLYVTSFEETVALDLDDGSVLWRADASTTRGGAPVVHEDTVYVPSGGITALDAETGDRRWRVRPEDAVAGVAVADRVYVSGRGNSSGSVSAYTHNGDDWWRVPDLGEVYAAPAVADGTVYAVSKTGTLTAIDAAEGTVRWSASVGSGVFAPPAVADGFVVVEAGNDRSVVVLDAESGEERWRFETGPSQGAPTVVGDNVLAGGANTGLHLLDLETGERSQHWPVPHVGSQPVVADAQVLYRAWNVSDVFRLA